MQHRIWLDPGREQRPVATARHPVASVGGPVLHMSAPVELVQGREHPDVGGAREHGHVVAGRAVLLQNHVGDNYSTAITYTAIV